MKEEVTIISATCPGDKEVPDKRFLTKKINNKNQPVKESIESNFKLNSNPANAISSKQMM